MELSNRLKKGVEAYSNDNLSQNDFIEAVGISRNTFFALKKNPEYQKIMLPITKRKLIKGLTRLGF